MMHPIVRFVLSFGAIVLLGTCKNCYKDTGKMEDLIDEKKLFVITLPKTSLCLVFTTEISTYSEAEQKCKRFSGGILLNQENIGDLKASKAKYDKLPSMSWFVNSGNTSQCQLFYSVTGLIDDIPCSKMAAFACQYPYQFNCAYEIVAEIDNTTITYRRVINQNSDVTKYCVPSAMPEDKECSGAGMKEWGTWSGCSKNCTVTIEKPPTKFRQQSILCKNTGIELSVFNNATCNTNISCPNGTTESATIGSGGSDLSAVLIPVVGVLVVLVLALAVVIAVLWHVRKRSKKSSVGKSAKSIVGKVPSGAMKPKTDGNEPSPRPDAHGANVERPTIARTYVEKDSHGAVEAVWQLPMPKSGMLKWQVPQKTSQMSKSPSSKVKAGKSQISRSPSSKVKAGKSQISRSPSPKVKAGKSQMSRSPSPNAGKSQMRKGSKLSPK